MSHLSSSSSFSLAFLSSALASNFFFWNSSSIFRNCSVVFASISINESLLALLQTFLLGPVTWNNGALTMRAEGLLQMLQ